MRNIFQTFKKKLRQNILFFLKPEFDSIKGEFDSNIGEFDSSKGEFDSNISEFDLSRVKISKNKLKIIFHFSNLKMFESGTGR